MIGKCAAEIWDRELEEPFLRAGHRFGRIEPRRRMRDYVRGLRGPDGRKNSWQLAEYVGHSTPDRLLNGARWDADEIRAAGGALAWSCPPPCSSTWRSSTTGSADTPPWACSVRWSTNCAQHL